MDGLEDAEVADGEVMLDVCMDVPETDGRIKPTLSGNTGGIVVAPLDTGLLDAPGLMLGLGTPTSRLELGAPVSMLGKGMLKKMVPVAVSCAGRFVGVGGITPLAVSEANAESSDESFKLITSAAFVGVFCAESIEFSIGVITPSAFVGEVFSV